MVQQPVTNADDVVEDAEKRIARATEELVGAASRLSAVLQLCIREAAKANKPKASEQRAYRLAQAAKLVGMSEDTLRLEIHAGRLKAVKLHRDGAVLGATLIRSADLDAWLAMLW
jgi:excisionase family DNA binding protein